MARRRPNGRAPRHALARAEREELRMRIVGLLSLVSIAERVRHGLDRQSHEKPEHAGGKVEHMSDGAAKLQPRVSSVMVRRPGHVYDGPVRTSVSGRQLRQKETPCSRA